MSKYTEQERLVNACIGAALRAARKDRGLTLKLVAAESGLSISLISQIELGRSAASVRTLHKLCKVLKVPLAFPFLGI